MLVLEHAAAADRVVEVAEHGVQHAEDVLREGVEELRCVLERAEHDGAVGDQGGVHLDARVRAEPLQDILGQQRAEEVVVPLACLARCLCEDALLFEVLLLVGAYSLRDEPE